MDCNVVKDLIPLYIDGCCSEESGRIVKEHIESCDECKKLLEDMSAPSDMNPVSEAPAALRKINYWKASVLQSVLLFLSFAVITVGVALEAKLPSDGWINGMWAFNFVVPATGFMLSLANWYFVRLYKNRKIFSYCSILATLVITIGAYIWTCAHYKMNLFGLFGLFAGCNIKDFIGLFAGCNLIDSFYILLFLNIHGIALTILFCILSKLLSNRYAKMLGKE